jgi:Asp/Glu/hydantoin racemase
MKKITIVHTSLVSHAHLNKLFSEIIPEAKIHSIVDDSLLAEVSDVGHITPGIVNRMSKYFQSAELIGSDLIFNQCSSVGEAAAIAAKSVSVPVLRVDEAMGEEAVQLGKKIAVVATVASTVEPSCNLVRQKAAEAGKDCEIIPYLVDGAMWALIHEGQEKHNKLVKDTVIKAAEECDVVILAQGSMVVLLPELADIKKPIFSSPELGVRKARKLLFPEEA